MEKRTTYCGFISSEHLEKEVTVKGWVQKRRDLGGLIFIDLRDREGIVQIVFNPETSKEALEIADKCRSEFVIGVTGKVVKRESAINPNMKTGEFEIIATDIVIYNEAKTPPFVIGDNQTVNEDTRMKYRFMDIRRPEMVKTLKLRHQTSQVMRNFLNDNAFMEVETPYLNKSTPEGARDYLVPSRVHEGHFYALPQSPQTTKQLLMGAGIDKYYQIVRCFRDEDLRGDRQPEFTQVDIETSFLSAEEIQTYTENMLAKVMKEVMGQDIVLPFSRMTYDDAIARYGVDKPDTRFEMELIEMQEAVSDIEFKVFQSALENGGAVKALNAKGAAGNYSRKDMDQLGQWLAQFGAKGLAWVKVEEDGLKGPIAKFLVDHSEKIIEATNAEVGDLLMFVADKKEVVAASLGALRNRLAQELGLINPDTFNFLWVVDWPLLEYDEEAGRYTAAHHPFTMPKASDVELLKTNPEKVYAEAYDIVLNGYELGGGSLRIYQREVQEDMFNALGFTKESAQEQFGFLMDALEYGFPPHGGIALGLDRLIMLLAKKDNIREVIAFPKNNRGIDLMTNAPGTVSEDQLEELHLNITTDEK